MKRILSALFLDFLLCPILFAQSAPFYYKYDQPKFLDKDESHLVIQFDRAINEESALRMLSRLGIFNLRESRGVGRSVVLMKLVAGNEALDAKSKLLEVQDVLTVHPLYRTREENAELYLADQICVQFTRRKSQIDIRSLISKYHLTVQRALDVEPYFLFSVSRGADALEIANAVAREHDVLFSHPNFYTNSLVKLYTPTDRFFDRQFNFYNHGQQTRRGTGTVGADIKMPQAWDISRGSASIQVTVIDDGLDLLHQDISSSKIIAGYDFADHDTNVQPVDSNAHGTNCAGLIAADHNTIGIAGISPLSKLQMMKVFRNNGEGGSADDFARAIDSARTQGADVMSNSWGFLTPDTNFVPAIRQAIIRAKEVGRSGKGCVMVFGAGNTANRQLGNGGYIIFPANISEVITVGASTRNDSVSYYSPSSNPSYHLFIELTAPSHRAYEWQIASEGFEVWSTDISGSAGYNEGTQDTMAGDVAGNYDGSFGGTSAACPQVAGASALLLSMNPNLTADQILNILISTADKVGGYNYQAIGDRPGASYELGYGRLNVYRAVSQLLVSFNFVNRIESTTNYGALVIDADKLNPVASGGSRSFPPNTNHVVRTNELPFVPNWVGTGKAEKHHHFYQSNHDFSLNHNFTANNQFPSVQDANFLETKSATVSAGHIDGGVSGGTIQFRDPWRYNRDANGNWFQTDSLISYGSPFLMANSDTTQYGGVFLNQAPDPNDPNKPYYSVGALLQQNFGGVQGTFQYWSGSNVTFRSGSKDTSAVVFQQPGATATAMYKGHLVSSQQYASVANNQRKLESFGTTEYAVYPSGGSIYFTKNSGSGWSNETRLSFMGTAKNPSIATTYVAPYTVVHVVWEETEWWNGNEYHNVFYRKSATNGTSWESAVQVSYPPGMSAPPSAVNADATPVVAGSPVVIVWKAGDIYSGSIKIQVEPLFGSSTYFTVDGSDGSSRSASLRPMPQGPYKVAYRHGSGTIRYREFNLTGGYPYYSVDFDYGKSADLSSEYWWMSDAANPCIVFDGTRTFVTWDALCEVHAEEEGTDGGMGAGAPQRHVLAREFTSSWQPVAEFAHYNYPIEKPSVGVNMNTSKVVVMWELNGNSIDKVARDVTGGSWGVVSLLDGGVAPNLNHYVYGGNPTYAMYTAGSSAPYSIVMNTNVGSRPLPGSINEGQYSGEIKDTPEGSFVLSRRGSIDLGLLRLGRLPAGAVHGTVWIESSLPQIGRGSARQPWPFFSDTSDFSEWLSTTSMIMPHDADAVLGTIRVSVRHFRIVDPRVPLATRLFSSDLRTAKGSENSRHFTLGDLASLGASDTSITFRVNIPAHGLRGKQLRMRIRLVGQDEEQEPKWSVFLAVDTTASSSSQAGVALSGNELSSQIPVAYALHPSYPNPFNPSTTIKFDLPENSYVSLVVYDVLGRKVAELVNGVQEAGFKSIQWDAANMASGIYFARFTAADAQENVKLSKVNKLLLTK